MKTFCSLCSLLEKCIIQFVLIAKEFLSLKGDVCLFLVFLKTHSNSLGRTCSFETLHAEHLQKLTSS